GAARFTSERLARELLGVVQARRPELPERRLRSRLTMSPADSLRQVKGGLIGSLKGIRLPLPRGSGFEPARELGKKLLLQARARVRLKTSEFSDGGSHAPVCLVPGHFQQEARRMVGEGNGPRDDLANGLAPRRPVSLALAGVQGPPGDPKHASNVRLIAIE